MALKPFQAAGAALQRLPRLATGRRLHPLHVHISVVFTVLMLISGALIGVHNYRENSNVLLSASNELFERIGRETVLEIDRIYAPIALLTDLTATQRLIEATTPADRLRALPGLREGLTQNPAMSAIYVGYDDGDFFLVRSLPEDEKLRRNLNAPPGAVFLVQSIDRAANRAARAQFIYLDRALKPVLTVERPDYAFDPRTRVWYRLAMASDRQVKTSPYVFYTTREPGITFARRSRLGTSVVGADITLAALSQMLRQHSITPSAELLLFDADGEVLAYTKAGQPLWKEAGQSELRLATMSDLGGPTLEGMRSGYNRGTIGRNFSFDADGRGWIGRISKLNAHGQDIYLGMLAPREELLHEAARIQEQSAWITLVILLLTIPVAWLLSRAISRPLQQLSVEARSIQRFNFDKTADVESFVLEIDNLAQAMDVMRSTIRQFLEISSALAAEKDLNRLLDRVVAESLALADADAAVVYLLDDDGVALSPTHRSWRDTPRMPPESALASLRLDSDGSNHIVAAAREGRSRIAALRVSDSDATARYFADALRTIGVEHLGLAAIPLHSRQREVIGVLVFGRKLAAGASGEPFPPELISFMEALSGAAAVSIETRRLLKAQKELLESLIQLIAAAIDAKSAYTGGHCQRVPEIAKMLARAACDAADGPYRDFDLSDEEWEAMHIACWLHDCGKVTTPEFVVDKATKLETIYDRIHEIRTRFEVLKRDAEIDYWKARAAGGEESGLKRALEAKIAELDSDFAFIAECNIGGEFMAPERIERLQRIAQRSWLRTLDDRIGVSHEEKARMERAPAQPLPVVERVLADKQEHIFERAAQEQLGPDNPWGFKLEVPPHLYNRGELYNLGIGRGTLTREDRFIVNDHIVQTIIMLSRLPFPKHLKQVPEFAGGHHEKMDGTGYPKRLRRSDLSPVARMLAIADIFEALTAADRPYKKGKTLSESIRIMGYMRKDGHIDPELFELFLTSGVYRRYAERYMNPHQIDEIDIRPYLSTAA